MKGTAGIVLAGGRSTRMGSPKAALEWRGSTLLEGVVDAVGRATGRVVVVRAPGQELPALPAGVAVVEDARRDRGPLEAMLAGMRAVAAEAEIVFVASVDLPFLHPAIVSRVIRALGPGLDAAVPVVAGWPQPLAAAYRIGLLPLVAELAGGPTRRMGELLDRARVARLDEAALLADPAVAASDPRLVGLGDVDTPADLARARARDAQPMRENGTGRPASTPSTSSATQASAVAPASEVTA
jgi:molybdopterin-guanine dinucleotide biosynthesis protein A